MTNNTRSPEEIEREIERERAGLSNTLDDLQDKFSVETIARQFSDQFREHGGDIGRSVSDAVKRNPVALALTGVGLAWLMMGDKSGGRETSDRDRQYDRRDDRDRYDGRYGDDYANGERGSHRYDDRNGRTHSPKLAGVSSSGRANSRYTEPKNTPSWAKSQDESRSGVTDRLRDTASGVGSSASNAASSAADTARNAGSNIADTAKNAAGAVSDAGKSVADSAQALAASTTERATALRERLAEGTEHFSEEARDRIIAARQSAVEARDAAMSYARQGRERAVDIFEEQPLIAGALAVALGAALGAALPRSRVEDEYFGDQSDHLMEEAERIFAEEKEKLGKVATAATDEAKKAFDEVKGDADTVAKAAMDKAKETGERIAGAAESEAEKQNLGDVKNS